MEPINRTEKLLEHILNKDDITAEQKKQEIEQFAYPDQEGNYNAGQACATCPPPHARKEFVDNVIDSLEYRYTVTIYTAYPGTPLNEDNGLPKYEKGKRKTSLAGHMWLQVKIYTKTSIVIEYHSYGFAPKKSGALGRGIVTKKDTIHYEKPYYNRELEIAKQQYGKIKEFGDLAGGDKDVYFDLYYNGVTNSCIDFTWQALRHAGIIPADISNDSENNNKETKKTDEFDGELKVIDNIPHIKSIPSPFPDSELNSEKYNEIPDRKFLEQIFSKNDNNPNDAGVEIASRQHDGAFGRV
ncbi:hypothetical protein GMW39_16160 [Pectobacterium parmentieri]|uniref:hypothetical protein n=1 Tax=Pectobacterium parmentieri TaxID=1905730 RepID=UPI0013738D3C|nr:hypothetical protein [Pectobacterium parmentieri]QHQ17228.1 hypothetical protein GMW39_16160 [Pectobacterium parmentieri]